jgi:mannose-6-phosphate isomerase-like protein (cupin superfamily)
MSKAGPSTSLLPRAANSDGVPEPEAWFGQPRPFTERARCAPVYWPAGASWFINDPLPPAPHSHPGASEIYFAASGVLQLTVGNTEFEMNEGDVCLIPPGAFHHPQDTRQTDLFLWCVVAPNWRGERLKRSDFTEDELAATPVVGNTSRPDSLPSDDLLETASILLEPGASEEHEWRPCSERLIYVLEGTADMTIGRLSGRFERHEFVHVPSGFRHRIVNSTSEPLRALSVYALDPPGRGIAQELGVAPGSTY